LVQCLLGLTDEEVDPNELMLDVGAVICIAADGPQRDAALAFLDRLALPPHIGQDQAPEDMPLAVSGSSSKLLLQRAPGGVGVQPSQRQVPAPLVRLGTDRGP